MGLFFYKEAPVSAVKFSRLVMASLAIASLFTNDLLYMQIFFILSVIGLFTSTYYSPIALLYILAQKVFNSSLSLVNNKWFRFYKVDRAMDIFDHALRIIVSGAALFTYHYFEELSWFLVAFIGVFNLLSAFMGFCLSAIFFILFKKVVKL
jgi:hypothetical protein